MVEGINQEISRQESQGTEKKLLWKGTKLPSSGCFVTVLTYLGYRDEVKPLLMSLSKAGQLFYANFVEKSVAFRDDELRLFPKTRWGSVRISDLRKVNVSAIGDFKVSQGKESRVKETHSVSRSLVNWLGKNTGADA